MPVVAVGLLRFQALEPGKAGALEGPAGRGRRDAGRRGDMGAVLAVTPNDATASARLTCPAITRRAISSRRSGADRAFLRIFIRFPLEGCRQVSRHDNANRPSLDSQGNLLQCHT